MNERTTPHASGPWPHAPSIDQYAAIGNCRTLALVSKYGGLDWLCVPLFSSGSIFASLLDRERGGCFAIRPQGASRIEQRYRERTNVLDTTFHGEQGVVRVTDFMAVSLQTHPTQEPAETPHLVVRIVQCVQGRAKLSVTFAPRPGYASEVMALTPDPSLSSHGWIGQWPHGHLRLACGAPLQQSSHDTLHAKFEIHEGQTLDFILEIGTSTRRGPLPTGEALLRDTEREWAQWAGRCQYNGPWAEDIVRSALILKLLNHAPSGAVVAAGTTSIPEGPHGNRNWDYRYCWLRDTSLVLQAFMDLGYLAEGEAFFKWLLKAARSSPGRIQVLYDVLGHTDHNERTLDVLRGYHGIGPVRIGNDAVHQLQLDIYGELMLTAHDFVKRGGQLDADESKLIQDLAKAACSLWHEPDEGIWEIRKERRHNTHSKLMCWAALDRAQRLHDLGHIQIDSHKLNHECDAIRASIEAHAYDSLRGSYVGYYGARHLDASLLLIPRLGYLRAQDPKVKGTVEAIQRELSVDGLLYRYPPGPDYDGVEGTENLFCICSFWLVECLAMQGRQEEAEQLFERLLALRNHAGIYAEELEVASLRPMGNFPQAFSHVGMITAALALWGPCSGTSIAASSANQASQPPP